MQCLEEPVPVGGQRLLGGESSWESWCQELVPCGGKSQPSVHALHTTNLTHWCAVSIRDQAEDALTALSTSKSQCTVVALGGEQHLRVADVAMVRALPNQSHAG